MLVKARNLFTSLLAGIVPASGGGTTNFLRADGTWNAPAGGGGGSGGLLPSYVANNFYWGIHGATAGATNTFSTTITRYTPIFIPVAMTLSALGGKVQTTNAGNFAMAIYANSPTTGKATGAPLAQTGSLSMSVAGIVTGAISLVITTPGIYWVATQQDNTGGFLIGLAATDTTVGFMVGAATAANLQSSASTATGLTFSATGTVFGTFGTNPTIVEANVTVATLPLPIFKVASVP